MDAERHLKSVEFKLLGLTHLLAVGYGASRKKKREVKSIKLVLIAVNLDV